MKIDPDKLTTNESRSNPMVVAMSYPDCPINEPCFFMAVGGAVVKQCEHLKASGDSAECTYNV